MYFLNIMFGYLITCICFLISITLVFGFYDFPQQARLLLGLGNVLLIQELEQMGNLIRNKVASNVGSLVKTCETFCCLCFPFSSFQSFMHRLHITKISNKQGTLSTSPRSHYRSICPSVPRISPFIVTMAIRLDNSIIHFTRPLEVVWFIRYVPRSTFKTLQGRK